MGSVYKVMGVDPGIGGGYAILAEGVALAEAFPVAGREVDLAELAFAWKSLAPDVAVVEAVHSMPKQGVSASFTFGRRLGEIHGILAALGIRRETVTPQAWKKVILHDTRKEKGDAIAWCRRAYPAVSIIRPGCRTPHDGMAEALCMAEYGRRVLGGADNSKLEF